MIAGLLLLLLNPRQAIVAELSYDVTPVVLTDRVDLSITVEARTPPNAALPIAGPFDGYGTPGLTGFLKDLGPLGDTKLEKGPKDGEWLATAGKDGRLQLKYRMSYDPQRLSSTTFGPNVGPTHFYAALGQWMICLGDWLEKRKTSITVEKPDVGWKLFSNMAQDPSSFEFTGSYQDHRISNIGGVAAGFKEVRIKDRPLSMFVPEDLAIPRTKIFDAIQKIVSIQRGWFNDSDYPYYNVVVLPREDSIAGTCLRNFFVCFVKPDATDAELKRLMAHEMFHNWLGQRITVDPPSDSDVHFRTSWFVEGFTEYFGRLILLESKLITEAQFAEYTNEDIINIADNPNRSITYAEAIAATKAGKYGTPLQKLGYYRGSLMALRWDTQIREKGKKLSDLIRELEARARTSSSAIPESELLKIAARYGADVADFDRCIVEGRGIDLDPKSLGPKFRLVPVQVPAFDPGFALSDSLALRKVVGLKNGSAAAKAGLQDGMEIQRVENSNRFSYAWNRAKPLTVVVKTSSGERSISYFPTGEPRRLMLFRPKGK